MISLRLYLAGPMRNIPFYNFPLFHSAAAELTAAGHKVFNPAQNSIDHLGYDPSVRSPNGIDAESDVKIRELLLQDLTYICNEADGAVFLPGAMSSSGAQAELMTVRAINDPAWPCKVYEFFSERDRKILGLAPLAFCSCP